MNYSEANSNTSLQDFLPSNVKAIDKIVLDLDETDLSIADIFRNVNKMYSNNSKAKFSINHGERIIFILCKTVTMRPYKGMILIISSDKLDVAIPSADYVVMSIAIDRIASEKEIDFLVDDITRFLLQGHHSIMGTFSDFYRKFIYNDYELYNETYESS